MNTLTGETVMHVPCFVVVCMCCGREKSRVERPDLKADRISHGICEPLCEPAIAAGWVLPGKDGQ